MSSEMVLMEVTAVKLFKKTKPDVVLIDLNMPNGSGFYAIKKFKTLIPKQKLLQFTADGSYSVEKIRKSST